MSPRPLWFEDVQSAITGACQDPTRTDVQRYDATAAGNDVGNRVVPFPFLLQRKRLPHANVRSHRRPQALVRPPAIQLLLEGIEGALVRQPFGDDKAVSVGVG